MWVQAGNGPATAARGILLSAYTAIWAVLIGLLLLREPNSVAALLFIQVICKLTTALTVPTLANPVVISNLGSAANAADARMIVAAPSPCARQAQAAVATRERRGPGPRSRWRSRETA